MGKGKTVTSVTRDYDREVDQAIHRYVTNHSTKEQFDKELMNALKAFERGMISLKAEEFV